MIIKACTIGGCEKFHEELESYHDPVLVVEFLKRVCEGCAYYQNKEL